MRNGHKNLFSEDIKGKDGVFSLKNESPDISGKGSFHSPVPLGDSKIWAEVKKFPLSNPEI